VYYLAGRSIKGVDLDVTSADDGSLPAASVPSRLEVSSFQRSRREKLR
jgi:hypothetical protein